MDCLGFWSAYIRNETILYFDCIKVWPTWQNYYKDILGNESFETLVIPGTHDSGTYTRFSTVGDNALMKYAITQDESIYNQLVYGNRYIDLRAGYFVASEEHYWLVHGVTVWRPFKEVLQDAKAFAEQSNEIFILEVGGFTYFENEEHHLGLIKLIEDEIGHLMIPNSFSYQTTLNEFWAMNRNIILIYGNSDYLNQEHLWKSFPSRWSNTQSIEALESYMIQVLEVDDPISPPWHLSGQLTPLADDVILDKLDGLRAMADAVNRNVTRWYREKWINKLSFTSCDFFLSAGYIDLAIETNIQKFKYN